MPNEDYSMDASIWNNKKQDYFIDENNFDINKKTKLPPGSELTVYNESRHVTIMTCFSTPSGNWISYKNQLS